MTNLPLQLESGDHAKNCPVYLAIIFIIIIIIVIIIIIIIIIIFAAATCSDSLEKTSVQSPPGELVGAVVVGATELSMMIMVMIMMIMMMSMMIVMEQVSNVVVRNIDIDRENWISPIPTADIF